jgi:uncharacterized protein
LKIRIDDLFDITRDPQHIESTIDLSELTEYSHIMDIGIVAVRVDIIKQDGNNYRVIGELQTDVGMVCSNCLNSLQINVISKLNELFVQDGYEVSDLDSDEDDYNYIIGQEIDLKPFIMQEILLSLPMKPLCQEHCKGLCPECGVNKNQGDCTCKTERVDPRLAGLADLFKENRPD